MPYKIYRIFPFETDLFPFVLLFFIISLLPEKYSALEKIMNIEDFGDIQGEQLRNTQQYLNIPYANPIGAKTSSPNERFSAPKPFKRPLYESIVNFGANRFKCHGLYANEHEDEDCLRLSVWTPNYASKSRILVFLDSRDIMYHTWGQVPNNALLQSVLLNGSFLASYSKAVVAVANFRNGPQGFLQLDKQQFGRNVGLSDAKMALNWIRKHAEKFGGDASQLTLMVASSGVPIAVQLLLENPDLAQKLILLSGNPLSRQTMFRTERTTETMLSMLNCERNEDNIYEAANIAKCLQKVSTLDLNRIARELKLFDNFWSPESEKLVRESLSRLRRIDVLIGINMNIGGYFTHQVHPKLDFERLDFYTTADFENDVKNLICSAENLNGIQCDLIKHEYYTIDQSSDAFTRYQFVSSLLLDKKLILPINEFLGNLDQFGYNRAYLFTLDRVSPLDLAFGALQNNESAMGAEVQYLFGMPNSVFVNWEATDKKIMAKMLDMLKKFIHTG